MPKLRIYCACIDGVHEELIATTSQAKAAAAMNSSVYQLITYGLNYDSDSEAGQLALSNPGVLFKSKLGEPWASCGSTTELTDGSAASHEDDVVSGVMLHSSKTKAYLRRLKKNHPNDWKRVYGNVFRAMVELDDEFIKNVKSV